MNQPTFKMYNILPVKVGEYDFSSVFTKEDEYEFKKHIDFLIDEKEKIRPYEKDERKLTQPNFQTFGNLFTDEDQAKFPSPYVFKKLKKTFLDCIEHYYKQGTDIRNNFRSFYFNAWGYRTSSDSNVNFTPIHNHFPAVLCGIFYVDVEPNCGTYFQDFQNFLNISNRGGFMLENTKKFSWLIFPGWLLHRPEIKNITQTRYIIAANLYGARVTDIFKDELFNRDIT